MHGAALQQVCHHIHSKKECRQYLEHCTAQAGSQAAGASSKQTRSALRYAWCCPAAVLSPHLLKEGVWVPTVMLYRLVCLFACACTPAKDVSTCTKIMGAISVGRSCKTWPFLLAWYRLLVSGKQTWPCLTSHSLAHAVSLMLSCCSCTLDK